MVDTLNQIIEDGYKRKLVHNYTSIDCNTKNSHVVINNHEMLNFGSCSYLGLEKHPSLKAGTMEAVQNYGTQFSSSRTYLSHGLYNDLEHLLTQIFNRPLIATASTTLGHLATIPIVVGKNDAVILDLQVHASIQMTVQQLKANSIPVTVIKHNCMESLERKIKELNNKHDKIWYFADGVYSMFGDYAPFEELDALLEKYERFHLYIDDAHGMSWSGDKGCGVVHANMCNTDKMILAVSLNKSFAAAGGCIIFPNESLKNSVRNCGSTYIFSGPIQPPMLGAGIASAKLHLSPEIDTIQAQLNKLINYTNERLDALGFPQYKKTDSPLFFIPVGLPKICYDIIAKMKEEGFFLNTASFPAVPMRKSGIRFMINTFLTKNQINEMLLKLSDVYSVSIQENGSSYSKIAKTFGIPSFSVISKETTHKEHQQGAFSIHITKSIKNLNQQEWDQIYANNGNLSYANVALVEGIFTQHQSIENKWDFYYIDIKDKNNAIVIRTFVSVALTKDDMFATAAISQKIEQQRALENPYYLTSKTVVAGTLITKGEHIYIDYEHESWSSALHVLTQQLNKILDENNASKILIRDFYGNQNTGLETAMLENGFVKFKLPNNLEISNLEWQDQTDYLNSLSQKYRYNVKKEILKFEPQFTTSFDKISSRKELLEAYQLYENVYEKSLDLNVFKLPLEYFEQICQSDQYDIIRIYLKDEDHSPSFEVPKKLVGVMFSQFNSDLYNAMIVGLDYQYVYSHNTYKQILYQTLLRARSLQCKKLDLAFTAELVKKKLGANPVPVYSYVLTTEHLKSSELAFV